VSRLKKSQLAYLIGVQIPGSPWAYYGVYADSPDAAVVAVSEKLKTTNETVEFKKVLTEGEARLVDLQPGEVKKYG
jgi:hypothetical protein